ncbi:hypothetical protein GCM10027598_13070 [Amycolatopsis oliviviridis]|uniref:Uncharacterized protein n=1 Tax=Amycolatopsis oliviviridis TaxID=1471590 RepID=A0ABQ3LUI8_9PSEU|nr:hypothetical protein GCM10017790_53070 [Amycolatopsis oliviviridis]
MRKFEEPLQQRDRLQGVAPLGAAPSCPPVAQGRDTDPDALLGEPVADAVESEAAVRDRLVQGPGERITGPVATLRHRHAPERGDRRVPKQSGPD